MLSTPALQAKRAVLRHGSLTAAAAAARRLFSSSGLAPSSSPTTAQVGRLNHVAIAVPDLEQAAAKYRDVLGAKVSSPQDVPEHGVTVVFVELPNTKLELLHPLGDKSPISRFLQKNPSGGIHHICLEVADVRQSLRAVAPHMKVLDPEPKIGAHGNPVAFLHPKSCDGVLTELEEVPDTHKTQC